MKANKTPKPRDPNWRWLRALRPKVKPNRKYDRKKTPKGWGSTSIDME